MVALSLKIVKVSLFYDIWKQKTYSLVRSFHTGDLVGQINAKHESGGGTELFIPVLKEFDRHKQKDRTTWEGGAENQRGQGEQPGRIKSGGEVRLRQEEIQSFQDWHGDQVQVDEVG